MFGLYTGYTANDRCLCPIIVLTVGLQSQIFEIRSQTNPFPEDAMIQGLFQNLR